MLLKLITNKEFVWHKSFITELKAFPQETQEDFVALLLNYINGEKLSSKNFKTFYLTKGVKIQEFRIRDHQGNWRVISSMPEKNQMVLLYAFNKKTQAISKKDKNIILSRIKRFKNEK